HWERQQPGFRRVIQDDWETPRCASWVERLTSTLATVDEPVVLAAHSAACAMLAHWAAANPTDAGKVRGALLVAPSDPAGPNYPKGPTGFDPVPRLRLPFRSIVVTSDQDPYVTLERAREYADACSSELVVLNTDTPADRGSGPG